MAGQYPKTQYYFLVRSFAFEILYSWEIKHWGSVSWLTKERRHTAIRRLTLIQLEDFDYE